MRVKWRLAPLVVILLATPSLFLAQVHHWSSERWTLLSESKLDICLSTGDEKRKQGDYEGAIQSYSDALAIDPECLGALYGRGISYNRIGKPRSAIADFAKMIDADVRNAKAWANRAIALEKLGQLNLAIDSVTVAIDIDPTALRMHKYRGDLCIRAGMVKSAIEDYLAELELDPKSAASHAGLGRCYGSTGDYDLAVREYSTAIKLDDGEWSHYLGRGKLHCDNNKLSDALSDFTRIIELQPNLAWGFNFRGQVLAAQGQYKDAKADYTRAIELNPNYVAAWRNRGRLLQLQGLDEEAVSDFSAALEVNAYLPWEERFARNQLLRLDRARSHTMAGDLDAALRDISGVAYQSHASPDALAEVDVVIDCELDIVGECKTMLAAAKDQEFVKIARRTLAMNFLPTEKEYTHEASFDERFQRALEIAPSDSYIWNTRGKRLLDAGHIEEAISDYRKSIEFMPTQVGWNGLGMALAAQESHEEATMAYTEAIKLRPDRGTICQLHRARSFRALGMLDQAISDCTDVIADSKSYAAAAYLTRGWCREDKGEHNAAVEDVREALRLDSQISLRLLDAARDAAQEGEYDRALTMYSFYLEVDSGWSYARQDRAGLLEQLKRTKEAEADYSQLIEDAPTYVPYLWLRAEFYDRTGRRDLARLDHSKAIEVAQRDDVVTPNYSAYHRRGLAEIKYGEKGKGLADLKVAFQLALEWKALIDEAVLTDLGTALCEMGDEKEATSSYNRAIKQWPDDVTFVILRAEYFASRRKFVEALRDVDAALPRLRAQGWIPSVASDTDVMRLRFKILVMAGTRPDAIELCTKLIAYEPEDARSYAERAWLRYIEGDSDLALRDIAVAEGIDPENSIVHWKRARILLATADVNAAVGAFRRALEVQGIRVSGQLCEELVRALLIAGNKDEALGEANSLLDMDRDRAESYIARAEVHRSAKDWLSAIEDYASALTLTKKDSVMSRAYLGRSISYLKLDKSERALKDVGKAFEHAQAAYTSDPQCADYAYCLACVLGCRGQLRESSQDRAKDLDKAFELLGQAIKSDPALRFGLEHDSNVQSLKDDDRFKELSKKGGK